MIPQPGAALLFDIDGTLADTDPLHLEAFNQTFAPFGHHFDKARFALELQGKANEAIAARFVPHLPPQEQIAVMDRKEALFRDLARTQIHAVPGLFDLLDTADLWAIPMAAVTNAPRPNAELILHGLGIYNRFKAIVIGAELAMASLTRYPISRACASLAPMLPIPSPLRIHARALHRPPPLGLLPSAFAPRSPQPTCKPLARSSAPMAMMIPLSLR